MAETQLDRIENMLKILVQANTTIELTGTTTEKKDLRTKVQSYTSKKQES